jgi:D-alanyl-D-alanine carboxypeptidase/D-alanyl-D-alanine-endopeptidase (penicillin-binding protein 4)
MLRPFIRLPAALVCVALWFTPIASAAADWPALTELEQGGARVSALAVDLSNNQQIQQLHAGVRLTPASLTKLVIAAAALNSWPADKMFKTRVVAAGAPTNGRIAGDLYLVGAGDPSLTGQNLWALAAQLNSAGVTSVGGRLVVVPAPFGSVDCETKDRCDALKISDSAFDAPLASIGIDFGTWCIEVRATAVGQPAAIVGCSAPLPLAIQGAVTTSAAAKKTTLRIERLTSAEGVDTLRVGGTVPMGYSQRTYRAMSDPALGVGQQLAAILHDLGIDIPNVVVRDGALPSATVLLAQTEGLSVKEQVGRMLRFSNNYIADVLTLTLAADVHDSPPTTLSGAGATLSEFMVRTHPRDSKAHATPPLLHSGSGLTPENQLSANDLVELLAYEYRNTRNFGAFYGGLVVPRQAPFAFLRGGSAAWQDRIALKTGTMNVPHSVCGVAGFMRKKDGGWIAFSIIVNGGVTRMKHVPLYKAMEAIRSDIEKLLARY